MRSVVAQYEIYYAKSIQTGPGGVVQFTGRFHTLPDIQQHQNSRNPCSHDSFKDL